MPNFKNFNWCFKSIWDIIKQSIQLLNTNNIFGVFRLSFIIMMMLLSVMIGLYSFKTFPKEASPAINVPFFTVSTVYPGADPETMEKQIIEKLENNLFGVTKIKSLKSVSAYNV